jgi:DNA ligase (NAD+)
MSDDIFDDIMRDPMGTLKKMPNKKIVGVLERADEAFFNTNKTLLSDDIYDIVKEYLKKTDGKNPYLKKIGADIEFNKEQLPFYLGSLDKIKDSESEIRKWMTKYQGNYVISEKLDGISCLLYYENGKTNLYTRGNGYEGQNITHMLPYLNIDNNVFVTLETKVAIRGELIISRANWENIKHVGANARNVVAGAIHSKKINRQIVSNIDFVAYDMMHPRLPLSESFKLIKKYNVPVVKNMTSSHQQMNLEMLSNTLQKWRKESKYEIDGIVIQHDEAHKLQEGKNPKYAFAFKTILTHEQAEVIVTDIEWNVSKHRYLKPTIKFNEISLGGVKIKQATGFNAAYIQSNLIGPGSHIVIVRSGDVIPHVLSVLTSSSNGKPMMPNMPYEWNETKIDILLKGTEKNKEHDIQSFTYFMNTLAIDGVKEGVITKLYEGGYDTLNKIINIKLDDLVSLKGFQAKSAAKIYEAIQSIKTVECDKLLTASGVFGRGFGEKKFKLITNEFPYISYDKKKAVALQINDIMQIKGIAEITALQFIKNLPKFYDFCDEIGIKCKKPDKIDNGTGEVAGVTGVAGVAGTQSNVKSYDMFRNKKVLFTGFRNKDYEQIIEDSGGKIVSSISKLTDFVIVKDINEKNAKTEKAKELNITILYKQDLDKMFS